MKHAQGDTECLKVLLKYIDYYTDPELIIKSIPDGTTLGEIREFLIEAFQQIKIQLGILRNFELLSKHFCINI